MLSYIYRIASEFRREHGYAPNTLLLNRQHLARLQLELAGVKMDNIVEFLGMDIRVELESGHPHVGWFDTPAREAG